MNKQNFSLLKNESSTFNNKQIKSEDGLYTLVYVCGPEFYLERYHSKDNDILFTSEPDEQGMYGGLKIGTTKIDMGNNGSYPTEEDCLKAFQTRYEATEDGISTVLIAGCILNGYIRSIDNEIREILKLVGNYNHPEKEVRKSEEIGCGRINCPSLIFNAFGIYQTKESIRKIGKEFIYNITRDDIETTLTIANNIANDLNFAVGTKNLTRDAQMSSICNAFSTKLQNKKTKRFNNKLTTWDILKIKNNIIRDIETNKNKCFKETPLRVIEEIANMIAPIKKTISIAIIAKTAKDVINISQNLQKMCTFRCKFTLICSYNNYELFTNLSTQSIIYINDNTFDSISDMKFDYIIQNPPYDGTLHLDYFDWCYNLQKKNKGKMFIIQPDSIYVDIREAKNRQTNAYRARQMKEILDYDKSVSKIIIENYNYDFETNAYYPHAITYVDFTVKHNTVDFWCYGYHKIISSIQEESNPFGDLKLIKSIMKKVNQAFPDKMSNHIARTGVNYPSGTHFLKYADIIGASGGGFAGSYGGSLQKAPALSETGKFTSIYGDFVTGYLAPNCHPTNNNIESSMIYSNNTNDGSKGNKKIDNVFGIKKELKNWIENSKNNILLLFINIVYTWDQHNHTKQLMPWLVDKVYSMNDVFTECKFTKEECEFIVKVVLMYRRDGAYFRRFLLGTNEKLINALKSIPSKADGKGIPENIKATIKVESETDVTNYINQCEQEAKEYVERRR